MHFGIGPQPNTDDQSAFRRAGGDFCVFLRGFAESTKSLASLLKLMVGLSGFAGSSAYH